MRKSVVLPTRSFTWVRGRPSGGGSVPAQGLVLILKPPSDQIDSAMPSKTLYWAPSIVLSMEQGSKWREGIVAILLDDSKSPGFTEPVRAEIRARTRNRGFPVEGEPCLHATSLLSHPIPQREGVCHVPKLETIGPCGLVVDFSGSLRVK
jgi:hypothetical protein